MRIMFDTNLFISAILFPDSMLARSVFEASEKFSLVISSQILDELRAVMKRKFPIVSLFRAVGVIPIAFLIFIYTITNKIMENFYDYKTYKFIGKTGA